MAAPFDVCSTLAVFSQDRVRAVLVDMFEGCACMHPWRRCGYVLGIYVAEANHAALHLYYAARAKACLCTVAVRLSVFAGLAFWHRTHNPRRTPLNGFSDMARSASWKPPR